MAVIEQKSPNTSSGQSEIRDCLTLCPFLHVKMMQTLLSNVHNSTHVVLDYASTGLLAVMAITYVQRIADCG